MTGVGKLIGVAAEASAGVSIGVSLGEEVVTARRSSIRSIQQSSRDSSLRSIDMRSCNSYGGSQSISRLGCRNGHTSDRNSSHRRRGILG